MRVLLSAVVAGLFLLGSVAPVPVAAKRRAVVQGDDFEYDVSRTDTDARLTFVANGWGTGTKLENDGVEPGAGGWMYTVTESGVDGGGCATFPSQVSGTRALMVEAQPDAGQTQTDFYLQLGNGSSGAFDNFLPADLWVQFWMCIVDSGSQQTEFYNNYKFFYVCNGSYGCSTERWMISNTPCNYTSPFVHPCGTDDPTTGFFWMLSGADDNGSINYTLGEPTHKVGHTSSSTQMTENQWWLVRWNLDTSVSGNLHARMWRAQPGQELTLIMDWQDGSGNFNYSSIVSAGGHREVRMPSTVGCNGCDDYAPYYMLMDDLYIAGSESDLPSYGETSLPPRLRLRTRTEEFSAMFFRRMEITKTTDTEMH